MPFESIFRAYEQFSLKFQHYSTVYSNYSASLESVNDFYFFVEHKKVNSENTVKVVFFPETHKFFPYTTATSYAMALCCDCSASHCGQWQNYELRISLLSRFSHWFACESEAFGSWMIPKGGPSETEFWLRVVNTRKLENSKYDWSLYCDINSAVGFASSAV